MTEEEFLKSFIDDPEASRALYAMVLRHLLNHVIDPRDSARGIIFSLERRLKELESK